MSISYRTEASAPTERIAPRRSYASTLTRSVPLRLILVLVILWRVCLPILINDAVAVLAAFGLAAIIAAFFWPGSDT